MMLFRYYDWIIIGIVGIIGLICSRYFAMGSGYDAKFSFGKLATGIVATVAIIIVSYAMVFWFRGNTASGIRSQKDYISEMQNGIVREITITAENGREIFHYQGKIDIETDPEKNYILFESEDGKRHIIYYGITDTITIIEK